MWTHWNGLEPVLIELIHERECLWKPDDPGYYNRSLKEKNLIDVAEILQLPPHEIKKKWHSMRVYFVKEWKKVEESRRNATSLDEIYKPKFKWFSNMMFIKDVKASLFRDEMISTEDELKPSSSSSGSTDNRIINVVEVKEEENDNPDILDPHLHLESDARSPLEGTAGGDITYLQDLRCRKKMRFEHKSTEVDEGELAPRDTGGANRSAGGHQERPRPPDTCHYGSGSHAMSSIFYLQKHDTFGLSVAEELRNMTPTQVSVAKLRIQHALFEVAAVREAATYSHGDAS